MKKKFDKMAIPLIGKTFSICQATYQKGLYFLFQKSVNVSHRVNIEISLTHSPLSVCFCLPFRHNIMVMQTRKPDNEGTLLGSNEKKNSGKELKKIEARLAERK